MLWSNLAFVAPSPLVRHRSSCWHGLNSKKVINETSRTLFTAEQLVGM